MFNFIFLGVKISFSVRLSKVRSFSLFHSLNSSRLSPPVSDQQEEYLPLRLVRIIRRAAAWDEKEGLMSDLLLFHKRAAATLLCEVSGRVKRRSRGHRVCVCLCHTQTSRWCPAWRPSLCVCVPEVVVLLVSPHTHSKWKGHGLVAGGAAARCRHRRPPRTLTRRPTYGKLRSTFVFCATWRSSAATPWANRAGLKSRSDWKMPPAYFAEMEPSQPIIKVDGKRGIA